MLVQRIANKGIRLGTLLERAAARHPATLVVLDHDLDVAPHIDRRATVAELADLVDDLAARLAAAGVRAQGRVVVHKAAGFDITLLALAISRLGAVPVLLSPSLDGATVVELLRRVDRPVLITDQAKLDNDLPSTVFDVVQRALLVSGSHARADELSAFAGAPRVRPVTNPPSRPALITHTSGTTGIPKLAVHTGATLNARHRLQVALFHGVRKRQAVAVHVSFVHSRMFTALSVPMYRGFPMLVLKESEPEHVARMFAAVRPGFIEAHPNSFLEWEDLAEHPSKPLSSVGVFSSTFDAIHPRTVRRMLAGSTRRWPLFFQLYGQSECGPLIGRGYTKRNAHKMDGRCVGYAIPGMTAVRVVSKDGKRPTEQSPGFIEVRTDGRIVTYLGEQERYDKQRNGGWWRMGDVGYKTKKGCLHLLDREVDEIPGFGSTLAVEDKLLERIATLTEVIIIPGADGRPTPVVCTKGDRPLDRGEWNRAVNGLPVMAEPVQWKHGELPQTATTKVKRLELVKLLQAGR
ncbi:AMP-binding protein [Kibdelosporangium phytohabitans]|uniref:Long-chain acyl-CoA synthetase n=1 Tax=Kibdelosporangium phytohabitans TaxID=860235 RepID=A0A0N7F3Q8_9PSEU|nr:class I adenylate-forming enzyme family protein [Kibdelosporangium phytohabitans]ALG09311.1 long-chain acyl-CoA synthetase [Kibdelosporangium phytohabitans]MBE1469432.1 acyl-coenzyme A synthetase/AMP-(fatty) acid ligase [Kibdelosporangium phytohabitans]